MPSRFLKNLSSLGPSNIVSGPLSRLFVSMLYFAAGCICVLNLADGPPVVIKQTEKLALLPSVNRQVFCVGARLKMDKHKAQNNYSVVSLLVGSMTTKDS